MTTLRGGCVRLVAGATLVLGMSLSSSAQADPPPAPDASPASAPVAAPSTAASSPTEAPPEEPTKRTVWPWILMGTGVALVVTATIFQFRAISEDDKREDDQVKLSGLDSNDPQRKTLQASADDHDDSAKGSRTASYALGTVGFLAIAGSVVWWFTEGGSSSTSTTPVEPVGKLDLKPRFTPSISPTYAGASLSASF